MTTVAVRAHVSFPAPAKSNGHDAGAMQRGAQRWIVGHAAWATLAVLAAVNPVRPIPRALLLRIALHRLRCAECGGDTPPAAVRDESSAFSTNRARILRAQSACRSCGQREAAAGVAVVAALKVCAEVSHAALPQGASCRRAPPCYRRRSGRGLSCSRGTMRRRSSSQLVLSRSVSPELYLPFQPG